MLISAELVPAWWLWAAWAAYLPLLARTLRRVDWAWLAEGARIHVFLGTCVALLVIWTMKAGVSPGLSYHFLGATILTLMFGWELALVGAHVVLIGTALSLGGDWGAFPANLLLKGALPVLVTELALRVARRRMPPHVFIYIFINGFFGAALAVLASVAGVALLLGAAQAYSAAELMNEYVAFAPFMMFGEAWITGMLVAIFVCYRPQWLATFDDGVYLHGSDR
jgi:uncharacterized membrane protein